MKVKLKEEKMISKELYEEVQKDYIDFKNITQDEYIIIFNKEEETVEYVNKHTWYEADSISIYKLAHKCKEWAYNDKSLCGYSIELKSYKSEIGCWLCELMSEDITFSGDTEPEAIFKACQWILDNKN